MFKGKKYYNKLFLISFLLHLTCLLKLFILFPYNIYIINNKKWWELTTVLHFLGSKSYRWTQLIPPHLRGIWKYRIKSFLLTFSKKLGILGREPLFLIPCQRLVEMFVVRCQEIYLKLSNKWEIWVWIIT